MAKYIFDEDAINKLQRMWEWWVKTGQKLLPNSHRRRPIIGSGSGDALRRAEIVEVPDNQSYIKASLLSKSTGKVATEGDEFEITVYADICGGERLDRASINLTIGQKIFVTQCIYDNEDTPELRWFFVAPFDSTEPYIGDNP